LSRRRPFCGRIPPIMSKPMRAAIRDAGQGHARFTRAFGHSRRERFPATIGSPIHLRPHEFVQKSNLRGPEKNTFPGSPPRHQRPSPEHDPVTAPPTRHELSPALHVTSRLKGTIPCPRAAQDARIGSGENGYPSGPLECRWPKGRRPPGSVCNAFTIGTSHQPRQGLSKNGI